MNIIRNLFNKKPKRFDYEIECNYIETLVFEGWSRTGDQLFTDEKMPLKSLIFHVFNFEYNDIKYEFKVNDDERVLNYDKHIPYKAFLNLDTLDKCWFNGNERIVYLWEPDDEEDEFGY